MPIRIDWEWEHLKLQKTICHPSNYPIISNVSVTSSGLVTWTTDIPSTSQVIYGSSPYLGLETTHDSTLVTSHSVQLLGLTSNVTYYLRVRSFYLDSLSTSDLYSFTKSFTSYPPTVSNLTTRTSFDADNTSIDELADVLGSLVNLFNTVTTSTASFTVTNVTTDRNFDATNTSLDELADVLGSLINSLNPLGLSSDSYTVSNHTTIVSYDADDTTLEELASSIGTLITSLKATGIIQ